MRRIKRNKIQSKNLNKQLKFLNNKNLNLIKIFKRLLVKLFKEKQIPFREFEFNNQSEQVLANFFHILFETVLIESCPTLTLISQRAS